jgi:hypothetical protein
MTPLMLTLLAACPKPAEVPAGPSVAVTIGPSPATPVSHLHCRVDPPDDAYEFTWIRADIQQPFTGAMLDHGMTRAQETWTCQVTLPDTLEGEVLGSATITITDNTVIPGACPNDDPAAEAVAPTVRSVDLGGRTLDAYDCPTPLGSTTIYMRLEAGEDAAAIFSKYATVGRGTVTDVRPISIPEELREDHEGDEERGEGSWNYFAIWNNAGVCFRACRDDWQFYAVQPDGVNLKIGATQVMSGVDAAYGFTDEGEFYFADRPDWRPGRDLFALEDRRVLKRGRWEERETAPEEEGGEPGTEEVWVASTVVALDAKVPVIGIRSCPANPIVLPPHDPETGEPAAGQSVTVSEGDTWEVTGFKALEGVTLFEVKKGWQTLWTVNQADPCEEEPADQEPAE